MRTFINTVFHSFLRELARTTPKPYFNAKNTIQSSVGMIFRLHSATQFKTIEDVFANNYDDIELLFTQRAGYEGDRNAYNIVFPGGQCDEGQSDLIACKRELFEQIGIKVDEQCLYLGQLPSNFYYLQKRGKKVYITCHIWCMTQNHMQWKEKLNKDELSDSKWVNLSQMLTDQNYLTEKALRMGIVERMISKYKYKFIADIGKNVLSITTPELNLGMNRNLWGLTLWLWSYCLQMACAGLQQKTVEESHLKQIKRWIDQMQKIDIQFKPNFWLKYPSIGVIKGWHYINRKRPFTYKRNSNKYIYFIASLIVIIGVLSMII